MDGEIKHFDGIIGEGIILDSRRFSDNSNKNKRNRKIKNKMRIVRINYYKRRTKFHREIFSEILEGQYTYISMIKVSINKL